MQISARNQLKGRIKSVSPGASIANIEIEVGDQRLVASITVEAADELELARGDGGHGGDQGFRRDRGGRRLAHD